eukprot:6480300-Amphidinium_carterae.2
MANKHHMDFLARYVRINNGLDSTLKQRVECGMRAKLLQALRVQAQMIATTRVRQPSHINEDSRHPVLLMCQLCQ